MEEKMGGILLMMASTFSERRQQPDGKHPPERGRPPERASDHLTQKALQSLPQMLYE